MSAIVAKLHRSKKTSSPTPTVATSPTPTVTPQGTPGSTAYTYKIVAKGASGELLAGASPAGSTATGPATQDGTNFNELTWTDTAGATSYDVYRTVGGATQGKIANVLQGVQVLDDTAASVELPGDATTPQAAGATSYSYKLVALNADKQNAAAGTAGSTTVGFTTLTSSHVNRLKWTDNAGADSYDVYRTAGGATQGKIGNVAEGIGFFEDTGLVGDGATPPASADAKMGIGKPMSVAHCSNLSLQCSGGGASFTGTVQVEGSIDGVTYESVGSAFTAAGFADVARRYALLRANETAYTSGDPQIWVCGVGPGGD